MMILPLADTLMNCLQNLTSRIAGVDNEAMTSRAMGAGAMMGYSLSAIKNQFTSSKSNTPGDSNNIGGANTSNTNNTNNSSFLGKVKNFINPSMNLSQETDYSGNVNPIRNVETKGSSKNYSSDSKTSNSSNKGALSKVGSVAKTVGKAGVSATKGYLSMGANMANGFSNKSDYYKQANNNIKRNSVNKDFQHMEEIRTSSERNINAEKGDDK